MEQKKKLTKAQIRKFMRINRQQLHYWQMMARMEARWYKGSINNARRYADEMKKLQQLEDKPK